MHANHEISMRGSYHDPLLLSIKQNAEIGRGRKRRSSRASHSSDIPALRSPAKYVASYSARIFGTPKYPTDFKRAMLEYRSSGLSLRASASSAAARSLSPLR